MKLNDVNKQYFIEFGTAMMGYVLILIPAIWVSENWLAESGWRYAVVVLPVMPLLLALRAYMRWLGRIDELQQRIQIQAIGFAAGATGILTFALGLLETAGFPRVPLLWVFPIMIFLWGIATGVASRRYE
jgi:hypothetical protein